MWLSSGPLKPGIRLQASDSILRIGNAAGEAHPIIGEGMSMALQSAWMLCTLLLAADRRGDWQAPVARSYAQQASEVRPNWGAPYLLIGRMYASSGPLCGPGRGWDSQVVVWAALDMWNRAKSVDSGSAAEAQKLINQYAQYMPKREDVFQRGLKTGDSFFIGCWIQRSTTIRTAN